MMAVAGYKMVLAGEAVALTAVVAVAVAVDVGGEMVVAIAGEWSWIWAATEVERWASQMAVLSRNPTCTHI